MEKNKYIRAILKINKITKLKAKDKRKKNSFLNFHINFPLNLNEYLEIIKVILFFDYLKFKAFVVLCLR